MACFFISLKGKYIQESQLNSKNLAMNQLRVQSWPICTILNPPFKFNILGRSSDLISDNQQNRTQVYFYKLKSSKSIYLAVLILLISTTGILPWPVNLTRGMLTSLGTLPSSLKTVVLDESWISYLLKSKVTSDLLIRNSEAIPSMSQSLI